MSLRVQLAKILHLMRKATRDDLAEEVAIHLAMETQENIKAGKQEAEARYAALRKFGNVTTTVEKSQGAWGWTLLEQWGQDANYSISSMRRQPLFLLSAVATLMLGMTAVVVVFSIVDAVLLRPASFVQADSITKIEQWHDDRGWSATPSSIYMRLRNRRDLFRSVVAQRRGVLTITRVPEPDQMFAQIATGNLFSLLDARLLHGRVLKPSDDSVSAPSVAVLSYRAWRHLFASDPEALGKTIDIDGDPTIVAGIMAENFAMPGRPADLWLPLRLNSADTANQNATWVDIIAKLRPDVSLNTVQAALQLEAAALNRERQSTQDPIRLRVAIWRPEDRPTRTIILWVALGTVAGLLAIACTNVSSLLMARGLNRRREYAIRLAIGASQGRLVRQSFTEALLLSLFSLAFALPCSAALLKSLREWSDVSALGIPDIVHAQIDLRIVIFSFAICSLTALISAALPSRLSASLDLFASLRESGAVAPTSHRLGRVMFWLTGLQAGICVALLLISGLLIESLVRLENDDHGIRTDRVLTLRLPLASWFRAPQTSEERLGQIRRYLNLLDRVRPVSGVVAAALTSSLPLSNINVTTHLQKPSDTARADSPLLLVRTLAVTRDYFRVMGIPVVEGQSFRLSDGPKQPKVVVVNQAFADLFFRGAHPIGRLLRGESGSEAGQIIGVVRNTAQLDLDKPVEPELFISFEQTLLTPFLTGMVVRTSGSPESLVAAIRAAISSEDPRQPVVKMRTLQSLFNENIALSRSSAWILSVFAALALTLSSAGVYGVVSFATMARQRDFGIRLCLGSTRQGIFRVATLQALAPSCVGIVAGLAVALSLGHVISAALYKAKPFDLVTAAGSVLVLLTITFAAAAIPALRSARMDPMRTLRDD